MGKEIKVGDTVVVMTNIPRTWWFKSGDIGEVRELPGKTTPHVHVFFPKYNDTGYVEYHHIEKYMNETPVDDPRDYLLAVTDT